MAQIKKTFSTAQEVREFLCSNGFDASFRKGLTRGEFKANGKVARFNLGLVGKTGQSAGNASWAYVVVIE